MTGIGPKPSMIQISSSAHPSRIRAVSSSGARSQPGSHWTVSTSYTGSPRRVPRARQSAVFPPPPLPMTAMRCTASYRGTVIERARFGRTGHLSTRTIFGAAAFSRATAADVDRARALVERFRLNHLDTAASYGDSELLLAPWLNGNGRDRFFLATKTGER